jgi:hypothetical protein
MKSIWNTRTSLGAVVVCLAAGALVVPAAGATTCSPRASATIVKTEHGRVFIKEKSTADGKRSVLYGCLYREGRIRKLGIYNNRGGSLRFVVPRTIRLTGRFVTMAEYSRPSSSPTSNTAFVEVDLRSGARVFDSGGHLAPDDGQKNGNTLYRTVVKANGSLAFIIRDANGVETVRLHDSTGDRILATGAVNEIFLELSRDRRTLTWEVDGRRESAPIR